MIINVIIEREKRVRKEKEERNKRERKEKKKKEKEKRKREGFEENEWMSNRIMDVSRLKGKIVSKWIGERFWLIVGKEYLDLSESVSFIVVMSLLSLIVCYDGWRMRRFCKDERTFIVSAIIYDHSNNKTKILIKTELYCR